MQDQTSPPTASTSSRPAATAALFVFAATLLAHLPALWGEFVNWDDPANITENADRLGFAREQLAWMWTTGHLGVFEPLSWMLKAAIHETFGMAAAAFHAVSWLLHGINAVLFFLIARLLVRAGSSRTADAGAPSSVAAPLVAPLVAALVFGLHPLRVECVAWASGQPYLLAIFFALICAYAYLRSVTASAGSWRWLTLSVVAYACSMLSKSIAVPLPAVLLVLDIYPLRRLGGGAGWLHTRCVRVWAEKAVFGALAAAAAWMAVSIPVATIIDPGQITASQRCAVAGYGAAFYVVRTVWPAGLSPFYALPDTLGWSARFILPGGIVLAITAAVIVLRRRVPALLTVWLVYLIFLSPVLGLLRHGDQLAADRYSYLACLSLAILVGCAVAKSGRAGRVLAAVMLVALAVRTWQQTIVWHDSEQLWSHAVTVHPDNWVAHNNFASLWLDRNEPQKARDAAEEALSIREAYGDAHHTLGRAFDALGDDENAAAHYRRAVVLYRDRKVVRSYLKSANNLGAALYRLGRTEQAINVYRAALDVEPSYFNIRHNLATYFTQLRRYREAEPLIRSLIADRPTDTKLRLWLATVVFSLGRTDEAAGICREVRDIDPDNTEVHYRLGFLLSQQAQTEESIASYRRFLDAEPQRTDARTELARTLRTVGRYAEAVAELEAGLSAVPGDPQLTNLLAWTLATAPKPDIRDGERALALAQPVSERLNHRSPEVLDTLAAALAEAGRFEEAVRAASRAALLAETQKNTSFTKAIEARVELYRSGRAYHESPK